MNERESEAVLDDLFLGLFVNTTVEFESFIVTKGKYNIQHLNEKLLKCVRAKGDTFFFHWKFILLHL